MGKPDAWYSTAEGREIVANILANQTPQGDWPKNGDTTKPTKAKEPGTFDNGATVGEIRFLARAYEVTHDPKCLEAINKAIDHILTAQYFAGGWPQFSPAGKQYHRHITLNDNTMVNLLDLLRDVAYKTTFSFMDASRKTRACQAFDRGVACLVKAQIRVKGELTVWCAQHDEITLAPRPARTFEPVSLSGAESTGVLMLLMSLDHPSPEIRQAIQAGAAWFEKARINGIRQETRDGNKVIVADPQAPALWARFYEIETNRPIFSSRDSVIKYDIRMIDHERRNGYAWYGNWGEKVAKAYAGWSKKHPN